MNVTADTAYCRPCGSLHRLSALLGEPPAPRDADDELADVQFDKPPRGCTSEHDGHLQTVAVRRGGGLGTVAGLAFMCVFWNGITSVFVLICLASSLSHAGVQLPIWFPTPDMDDDPIPLGMTLFMWVFLTPFILVGLTMLGTLLVAAVGRVAVRFTADAGSVFIGVGPIGWRRRFDPREVTAVKIGKSQWQSDGEPQPVVMIQSRGGHKLRFGSMLSDRRRAWLVWELRRVLLESPHRFAGRY